MQAGPWVYLHYAPAALNTPHNYQKQACPTVRIHQDRYRELSAEQGNDDILLTMLTEKTT